jgi:hypothetical protein
MLLAAALNPAIHGKIVIGRKEKYLTCFETTKASPAFMDEVRIVDIRAFVTNEAKAKELWALNEGFVRTVFKY